MTYQTGDNMYAVSKYIVDKNDGTQYSTIQAAINDANADGLPAIVYIRPGDYIEDLTLYASVDLVGDSFNTVYIDGTHTPPDSGTVSLSNITFQSTTDVFSSLTPGTTSMVLTNCSFLVINGYSFNLPHWTGAIATFNCQDLSPYNRAINNTGGMSVSINDSFLGNSDSPMQVNGVVYFTGSTIGCPVLATDSAEVVFEQSTGQHINITDSAILTVRNSLLKSNPASESAINTASSGAVTLENAILDSDNNVIDGTGEVIFGSVTYMNSALIGGSITRTYVSEIETGDLVLGNSVAHGVLIGEATSPIASQVLTDGQLLIGSTGNDPVAASITSTTLIPTGGAGTLAIETEPVLQTDTGFTSWSAVGPYFDDTVLGDFTVLVGGTGYIKGVPVTWAGGQSVTGLTAGNTYWIYIDDTGTIGVTSTRTNQMFFDYIVLFECLRDSTPVTNNQVTVKENHPYDFPVAASNYVHETLGSVIESFTNGANITLNGTQGIQINGTDTLVDHGLNTTISDSAGVAETWRKYYTTAGGKWALYNATNTFLGVYNNAGTPTVLGGSKFGVYTLYVSKDNLNTTTPTYFAVLDTTQYNNQSAATTAIANGTTAKASNELMYLELAQLGYIIYSEASASIVQVIISKSQARATVSTSGTNQASLVNTNTASFNGILSAADTNVQSALDTIDNWGAGATNHAVLIGRGVNAAITATAVGATGAGLMGVTGADPSWTGSPSYSGTVTGGTGLTATTGNVTVSAGLIALPTTSSTAGQITTGGNMLIHAYGTDNIFAGIAAGNFTLSGGASESVGIGNSALNDLTTGGGNCAVGACAGCHITEGNYNCALGQALWAVTTGSSNLGAGNQAGWQIQTGSFNCCLGANAGNALTGSDSYNIMISNTGTAGLNNKIYIGNETDHNACLIAGNVSTTSATAGATRSLTVSNSDNSNTSSASLIKSSTAGSSAGDAQFQASTTTTTWTLGIDNSVTSPTADPFLISQGTALGTNDVMSISTGGCINYPLQPMFSVYLSADVTNATGDGTTVAPVPFNTESFDTNSNFNTGTYQFSAPVTGHYWLSAIIYMYGIASGNTACVCQIHAGSRYFQIIRCNPYAVSNSGQYEIGGSALAYMAAGDTAQIELTVSKGSKVVSLAGGQDFYCRFFGFLVG